MNNLTKIAALPQAGGCMSALPAEVGEQPVKVQMKAPYFDEPDELVFPPIDAAQTVDEMARKLLARVQGGQ